MSERMLLVAVEDEPYPRGPTGKSCALKLTDWLDLARHLHNAAQLEVCPLSEISGRRPAIVEAFSNRTFLLGPDTFPTLEEHALVERLPAYWRAAKESGVPAIPVLEGEPARFPVFARGEQGTFAGGGRISSKAALDKLRRNHGPLVLRPFVEILRCASRADARLELRVHVVCSRAAAVEFLFPAWASQRPTREELANGHNWATRRSPLAVELAERLAAQLACRWFVADFVETKSGFLLVELNPGWCSGVAHAETARAVHARILSEGFCLKLPVDVWPKPGAGVPFACSPR